MVSRKLRDREIADEIESVMRRDYWREWSRTELASRVDVSAKRAKGILERDPRFRETKEIRGRVTLARWNLWD